MRYSWDFFTDLLDNMTDLEMLKLKEKDYVSVTHMRQMGTLELRRNIHRVSVYELSPLIVL